jgi:hypothetical protein
MLARCLRHTFRAAVVRALCLSFPVPVLRRCPDVPSLSRADGPHLTIRSLSDGASSTNCHASELRKVNGVLSPLFCSLTAVL